MFPAYASVAFLFFFTFHAGAFELPQINLASGNKPEITLFRAEDVLVQGQPSYELRWETLNATDVNITFFGKVEPSGTLIITDAEYYRGPITLTAWSTESDAIAKATLNEQNSTLGASALLRHDLSDQNKEEFYPMRPYPRRLYRPRSPYRRRPY